MIFWLREGLVKPLESRAGKGKHLKFDPSVVPLVRLLALGRDLGLNIDALRAISDRVGAAIDWIHQRRLSASDAAKIVVEENRLSLTQEQRDEMKEYYRSRQMYDQLDQFERTEAAQIDLPDTRFTSAARELIDGDANFRAVVFALLWGDGMICLYRTADAEWRVGGGSSPIWENGLPSPYCVLFDLSVMSKSASDGDSFQTGTVSSATPDGVRGAA